MLNLTKRQKIGISTIFLSISLFLLPNLSLNYKFYALGSIVLLSYLLSAWAIFLDLAGLEFITLFVLPTVLTASFGLFFLKFQTAMIIRLILILIYALVYYTIVLAENIFNVSAERNIPLLRAANTVGYLTTLFVSFAFFSLLFGLGISGWLFSLLTFLVGVLLFAQAFWQIKLEETNKKAMVVTSLVAGLVLSEFAWLLIFWPLTPAKIGLGLAAMVYVLLGIIQHLVKEDLSVRSLFEYLFVAVGVFLLLAVTTSWG